jgi:monoamine oxidase
LDHYLTGIKENFQGKFSRTQWQKEPFIQGCYTSFQPNQLTEFSDCFYIESEKINGNKYVTQEQLIFAGEQFSSDYYGYMNGGAQTGRLAVQYLLEHLQKTTV